MATDSQKIVAFNFRDGRRVPANMVVISIGIRPNTSLFEGQLAMEKVGIKVNGYMQASNSSIYAAGDVAAFPVKPFNQVRKLEHADSERKSAKHAVAAIMDPKNTSEFDYLPLFYSRGFKFSRRVFTSWQHLRSLLGIQQPHLVGSFLEGGTKEQYQAFAKTTRVCPQIQDLNELERQGLGFTLSVLSQEQEKPPQSKSSYWNAAAGILVAAYLAGFAYWYGRERSRG